MKLYCSTIILACEYHFNIVNGNPHLSIPSGSVDCIHDEDVGVICLPPVTETTNIGESTDTTSASSSQTMGIPNHGGIFVNVAITT